MNYFRTLLDKDFDEFCIKIVHQKRRLFKTFFFFIRQQLENPGKN